MHVTSHQTRFHDLSRSSALLFNARSCPSPIVRLVFQASRPLIYTSYSREQHAKTYCHQGGLCANVIRDLRGLDYGVDSEMFITISS